MGSLGAKQNTTTKLPDEFNGLLGDRDDVSDGSVRLNRLNQLFLENGINPHANDPDARKNGYRTNCALCATAVGLQSQGYDVEAMPRDVQWRGFNSVFDVDYSNPDNYILASSDYTRSIFPSPNYNGKIRVTDPKTGTDTWISDYPKMPRGANAASKAIEDKVKSWGNGAVGYLYVKWKGHSTAHAVNVLNVNGKVKIYDSQINKLSSVKELLDLTTANRTYLVRLDNAPLKKGVTEDTLNKMFKKRTKKG